MQLSITSDFARDTGCPEPYLREIAEAGFSHIHWCHHWNTDFLYSTAEVDQIGAWLNEFGLKLLDLHASDGNEKNWSSLREYERLAGVELVRNRIDMAATLGGDAIVMHVPRQDDPATASLLWDQLRRSLDSLAPYARACHIRIAVENGGLDSVNTITRLFAIYEPDFLGLCFDCGHANMTDDNLHILDRLKDRLAVTHLHDNDGTGDHHNLPFTGTVDWARLSRLIAASAYHKPVSMESNMHRSGIHDEREFLSRAYAAGVQLTGMVEQARAQM